MKVWAAIALLAATVSQAGLAQSGRSLEVETVLGAFRGACESGPAGGAARFVYRLGVRAIPAFSRECIPGNPAHDWAALSYLWQWPGSTTLLAIEPVSSNTQRIRLLHFAVGQPPSVVEIEGNNVLSSRRLAPAQFQLVVRSVGYARGRDRMDGWRCRYRVNFRTRRVDVALVRPYPWGVPPRPCHAEIVPVPLS